MRTLFKLMIIFLLFISCSKYDNDSLESVSGLSLYWDHEVFGEEGRRLRFEFYDPEEQTVDYELVFRYELNDRTLHVFLVDKIDRGKCQAFPSANGPDSICVSKGGFYIPDTLLVKEHYQLNLHTKDFEVSCEFNVKDDFYQLIIPANEYFTSSIGEVYPIPNNIVYGSIVFNGIENSVYATKLKEDLLALGLLDTLLPNYPYRHLKVNNNGTAINESWPPDNYLLGLVYDSKGISFRQIVETCTKSYSTTDLNIYLYSGIGDQARFNQLDGISIVYAKK